MMTHASHLIGTCLLVLVLSTPATTKIANIEEKLAVIDTMLSDIPFKIPDMAVGIVAHGETIFQKGYGLRDHADNTSRVTPRTLFGIGSCSKPFTTYALDAIMNEYDLLKWSDPVLSHVAEFRLRDVITRDQIKIIDLVTHLSGLPAHELAASHPKYTGLLTPRDDYFLAFRLRDEALFDFVYNLPISRVIELHVTDEDSGETMSFNKTM